MTAAKTAWLMRERDRIARICRADSVRTGGRHSASNSRMVRSPRTPARSAQAQQPASKSAVLLEQFPSLFDTQTRVTDDSRHGDRIDRIVARDAR